MEEEVGDAADHSNEMDEEGVAVRHNPTAPKFAFLAISELDDGYTNFEFFNFHGVLGFLTPEGAVKLREALKVCSE